jgi:hypothetical protein
LRKGVEIVNRRARVYASVMTYELEKRLLQISICAACLVPILAGLCGVFIGADMLGGGTDEMDSHFRYLSGLLAAIGFAFLAIVPRIETRRRRFRVLTAIVVTGGVGRLLGVVLTLTLPLSTVFALFMELVVTPGLCRWQARIAQSSRGQHPRSPDEGWIA